jgi:hypothetical protein
MSIGRNLGGRQDQGRVRRGVARRELLDGIDVAGIRDHDGHGGELIEQIGHTKPRRWFQASQPVYCENRLS